MADTVRRVEYHYVTVADSPGEGDQILSALKADGVDLIAFLGFPAGSGQIQLDLVPADPEALRAAAERAGIVLSGRRGRFSFRATTGSEPSRTRRRSWRPRTSGSRLLRRPARARGATA